jgi:YHS domain-containing protein
MAVNMKPILLIIALSLAGCGVFPTRTVDGVRNVNLQGYDPTAYFDTGRPTRGDARWQAAHGSVTYFFASAANRDRFQATPTKYAPQYGGWCSQGVAYAVKLGSDPQWFRVVDGKLYIYGDQEAYDFVGRDLPRHIALSDQYWAEMKDASWGMQYVRRVMFNRVPHWKDSTQLECEWLEAYPDKPHAMFKGRKLDCAAFAKKRAEH